MVNLLLIGVIVLSLFGSNVKGLGVNWGTKSTHQLPPDTVVQMLQDNEIKKVKLFDVDSTVLNALADTDIEVMVGIKNVELEAMTNKTYAVDWVYNNVVSYVDKKVKITSVAVGNEPFLKEYEGRFINSTRPALERIQKALNDAKVGDKIKATVPFNGDIFMSPPWKPLPSAGILRPEVEDEVEEIADFLGKNNAPFIVNIHPFLSLAVGDGGFPMEYAFFNGDISIQDGDIEYTNFFDAKYDTCVSALKKIGHENMTIVVGEIGWPTDGSKWANNSLASKFYDDFLPRISAKKGTPLHPDNIEVYLFELLDEDTRSTLHGDFERHWGIFNYAGQPKFKNATFVGAKDVKYQSKKWCILKDDASFDKLKLTQNMLYACEIADCSAFAEGGSCSGLDDVGKLSYALNAFFQVANQSDDSCEFGGIATQVDKDPSTDLCKFNIQIKPYDPSESSWTSWFSSSHITDAPSFTLLVLVFLAMGSLILV